MQQNSKKEFPSFLGFGGVKRERLAVILAGGDGSRLKSLTRAITGDERPKQFCPILGGETLLDKTRERVLFSIEPENIFYSLTKKHEKFYSHPLAGVGSDRLIVQPENKGTAPAILYSLLRLAATAPEATVAFFPSDHYFTNDVAFMENVDAAYRVADREDSIILLGIEPEKPETAYGWIEPAESIFGGLHKAVSRVKRFWEKPASDTAEKLMMQGCLWNSFVMVGKIETFLAMFRRHLPDMLRMFAAASTSFGRSSEGAVLRSVYAWVNETNSSSEVLEKESDHLLVMRVGDVGWSDWGEPQRVLGTLVNLGVQTEWMAMAS
jgi:mannose-1-phosphate guanylyltransferase